MEKFLREEINPIEDSKVARAPSPTLRNIFCLFFGESETAEAANFGPDGPIPDNLEL